MSRVPAAPYRDPLDHIWIEAARRIGLRVVRTDDAYAHTDGRGVLAIATARHLDPDDSLAQMIFHELCHSLVEGADAFARPDWGLDNETDRDLPRERACLRAQAALAAPLGLREFLAPTTDHRAMYDALPDDPLAPADDPTSVAARRALARADRPPWAPHLRRALAATAGIARAARDAGAAGTLFATVDDPWPVHRTGAPIPPWLNARCGDCAWRYRGGRGRAVDRCRQARGARVDAGDPACERFERALDCLACGACCREAYDAVELSPREPLVTARPDLIDRRGRRLRIARAGGRCAALAPSAPYACAVYELRPRTCREF
ncbi:MAG: YkgJ family cysteine cluster protein, partial [Deltaproteobacteria bacterium]